MPLGTSTDSGPLADLMAWQAKVHPTADTLAAGRTDPLFMLVAMGNDDRRLEVWRKGGAADARYTAIAARDHVPLVFRSAVLSRLEADRTGQTILGAERRFRRLGVEVTTVGSGSGGPVEVGLDRVTPQAVELARRLAPYGPATVAVVERHVHPV